MNDDALRFLQKAHNRSGELLRAGNRLLACGLLLGSLFCVLSVYAAQFVEQPEQALKLQAFMVNYAEFNRAPRHEQTRDFLLRAERKVPSDPNWDGVLAGASLGLAVGRNIPIIGVIICPVVGAMVGYQLDSKV